MSAQACVKRQTKQMQQNGDWWIWVKGMFIILFLQLFCSSEFFFSKQKLGNKTKPHIHPTVKNYFKGTRLAKIENLSSSKIDVQTLWTRNLSLERLLINHDTCQKYAHSCVCNNNILKTTQLAINMGFSHKEIFYSSIN